MVGGLGSNGFLMNYLKSRLPASVTVKQPQAWLSLPRVMLNRSATAIMRGAVLYKLGLKVKERNVRRHYGLAIARPFRIGDPVQYLTVGNEGMPWCRGVMKWFVNKVSHSLHSIDIQNDSIPDGHVIRHGFYSDDTTEEEWNQETMIMTSRLLYCDDDIPPEYRTPSMVSLIHLMSRCPRTLQARSRCEETP